MVRIVLYANLPLNFLRINFLKFPPLVGKIQILPARSTFVQYPHNISARLVKVGPSSFLPSFRQFFARNSAESQPIGLISEICVCWPCPMVPWKFQPEWFPRFQTSTVSNGQMDRQTAVLSPLRVRISHFAPTWSSALRHHSRLAKLHNIWSEMLQYFNSKLAMQLQKLFSGGAMPCPIFCLAPSHSPLGKSVSFFGSVSNKD